MGEDVNDLCVCDHAKFINNVMFDVRTLLVSVINVRNASSPNVVRASVVDVTRRKVRKTMCSFLSHRLLRCVVLCRRVTDQGQMVQWKSPSMGSMSRPRALREVFFDCLLL